VTSTGKIWAWGYLLQNTDRGLEFRPTLPVLYSDYFNLPSPLASLHAGSTHTLLSMEDGTMAVYGENLDNVLVRGPDGTEVAMPPIRVFLENGQMFRVRQGVKTEPPSRSHIAQHLLMILQSELDSNVELISPSGDSYHLHRVVLAARAPNLLNDRVPIPSSKAACKQLFEWVYTQHCDLSELSVLEIVEMLQTVQQCSPCLGQLHSRLEQTFVQRIAVDKEENILVAENSAFMESASYVLVQWVKSSLAEHLANQQLNERDLARLSQPLVNQICIASHVQSRTRPQIATREEQSIEASFVAMLQAGETASHADFEIRFDQGPSHMVHGCFISRCAFFEALLRNLNPAQGRVFMSKTPRSAMLALLRYLYGGELFFSPWDALFLMSPENGVSFYFAADKEHNSEVELIDSAMHLALAQIPIRESVDALLQARGLGIGTAEAALVDLMADNFDRVEDLLDKLRSSFGDGLVLEIQRSIIHSLLSKGATVATGADTTMNEMEIDEQ
jgi:hypothetical protein